MAPPPGKGGTALELEDMQGLVARGYGNLPSAAFVLVSFPDGGSPRKWLEQLTLDVTPPG